MAVKEPPPEVKERVERALVAFMEISTKVADKVKGIKVDDILQGGVNPLLVRVFRRKGLQRRGELLRPDLVGSS